MGTPFVNISEPNELNVTEKAQLLGNVILLILCSG